MSLSLDASVQLRGENSTRERKAWWDLACKLYRFFLCFALLSLCESNHCFFLSFYLLISREGEVDWIKDDDGGEDDGGGGDDGVPYSFLGGGGEERCFL